MEKRAIKSLILTYIHNFFSTKLWSFQLIILHITEFHSPEQSLSTGVENCNEIRLETKWP